MNEARIRSLDALVEWRSSMIVFQTKARRSVSQITDEVKGTRQWLETVQRPHWEMQIKKRSRKMDQANQELISARFSTLKDNLMVQEQALRKAKVAVKEAEDKLRLTKRWILEYDRVVATPVRKLENLHHYVDHELPKAILHLQQLLTTLEGYTASTLEDSSSSSPPSSPETLS